MKRILCAVVSALFAVSAIHGEETAAIEGQVPLAQTGAHVAGATVNLLETGASTIADEQGRFQFEGVRPGRHHLYAHIESALQGVSEAIKVAPDSTAGVQLLLSFSTQKTQITVSAAGRPESAFEALQPTHSLTALELASAENISAGLGGVLGNQPGTGIAQRGFGPGSSRPVIRGFDGDRVLIMADGLRTGSISAISGDHAETFNPLSFDRLERLAAQSRGGFCGRESDAHGHTAAAYPAAAGPRRDRVPARRLQHSARTLADGPAEPDARGEGRTRPRDGELRPGGRETVWVRR